MEFESQIAFKPRRRWNPYLLLAVVLPLYAIIAATKHINQPRQQVNQTYKVLKPRAGPIVGLELWNTRVLQGTGALSLMAAADETSAQHVLQTYPFAANIIVGGLGSPVQRQGKFVEDEAMCTLE